MLTASRSPQGPRRLLPYQLGVLYAPDGRLVNHNRRGAFFSISFPECQGDCEKTLNFAWERLRFSKKEYKIQAVYTRPAGADGGTL